MSTPRKAERKRLAAKGEAQRVAKRGASVGSYPTDTKGRAVAAKGYATKAVRAGRMSKETEASIDRRADAKLKKRK